MLPIAVEESIREKYEALKDELDERGRRLWAATEANALGHGGVATVNRATALSVSCIRSGQAQLREPRSEASPRRVRRAGAGRKPVTERDPDILAALEVLVDPTSRGDPESPLRWTRKSTRRLASELTAQGHPVSHATGGQLLATLGYSLQSTRKMREGSSHPDRDVQFKYITAV